MAIDQEKISSNKKSLKKNDNDNEESEKEQKDNEQKLKENGKKDKVLTAQEEYIKTRKTIYEKLRLGELGWRLHENCQYSKSKLRKLFYAGDDNAVDYKFCLEFSGSDPWAVFEDGTETNFKINDI
ncbi:Hypothetical protein SRAE_2000079300 [Strongyloides ratti]|uniref:Uncharacterized protein n=1 Tax=Strongyloides ratti TaxID=34506 RepID=A0A090LDA8_STRRB|nr:Hypothetical protein SRAE_2000079300 [Strongyloides ratti]CEF66123.1 Hypothetical protein SRAE_2000079300 [Strongyloides ratti]